MAAKRKYTRKKQTRNRRSKSGINLLSAIETYLLLNSVTQGAFRTSPIEFLLTPEGFSKVGADSTWRVSLPEILKMGTSGKAYSGVASDTLAEVIKSNLGMNPQIDGQLMRIPIPSLNEERRTELKKIMGGLGEKAKISIRNIRREANDILKKDLKDKKIGEDESKNYEKKIQNSTDKQISELEKKLELKEKEIMII